MPIVICFMVDQSVAGRAVAEKGVLRPIVREEGYVAFDPDSERPARPALTQNDNCKPSYSKIAGILLHRKQEHGHPERVPVSLQDLTRLMAVSGRRMPRECSPKSGCARVRLVFDVLGLSRYLRRLERGMWAFVVYPASSRERITMTKNIFAGP